MQYHSLGSPAHSNFLVKKMYYTSSEFHKVVTRLSSNYSVIIRVSYQGSKAYQTQLPSIQQKNNLNSRYKNL